eukprot:4364113-Pleurochrysis_carterae.AAC.4
MRHRLCVSAPSASSVKRILPPVARVSTFRTRVLARHHRGRWRAGLDNMRQSDAGCLRRQGRASGDACSSQRRGGLGAKG